MPKRELTDRAQEYADLDQAQDDPLAGIKAKYQIVFKRQVGTSVLADMLMRLGLLGKLDGSLEQATRHNYAIELLGLVGIVKPDEEGYLEQTDMEKILEALMGIKV